MKIQILVDNPLSWILPYAKELNSKLSSAHEVKLIHRHDDVEKGDVLCLLACEKIFKNLKLNKNNLVVHESALPKGKGWSPVTWQLLEGEGRIPVSLIEASSSIDSGDIYNQIFINLDGSELLQEIKHQQGLATEKLILSFINSYPKIIGIPQKGESTFYLRRGPEDSNLDMTKSLDEQFNLLRVCDNERYPAYFIKDNQKYIVKIYKEGDEKI